MNNEYLFHQLIMNQSEKFIEKNVTNTLSKKIFNTVILNPHIDTLTVSQIYKKNLEECIF